MEIASSQVELAIKKRDGLLDKLVKEADSATAEIKKLEAVQKEMSSERRQAVFTTKTHEDLIVKANATIAEAQAMLERTLAAYDLLTEWMKVIKAEDKRLAGELQVQNAKLRTIEDKTTKILSFSEKDLRQKAFEEAREARLAAMPVIEKRLRSVG